MSRRRLERWTPGAEALEGRALLTTLVPDSGPNNRPRHAEVVALDPAAGPTRIVGAIDGRRDVDYYRVTTPADGVLFLHTGPAVGGPAARVDLRGGGRHAHGLRGGRGIAVPLAAGQSVLIRARGAAGARYDLEIDFDVLTPAGRPPLGAPPPGLGSPPPTLGAPIPLPFVNGQAIASGSFSGLNSLVYTFTPPSSGNVALSASYSGYAVQVQNASGVSLLAGQAPISNGVFPVAQGATYTLQLTPIGGSGPYQVVLRI